MYALVIEQEQTFIVPCLIIMTLDLGLYGLIQRDALFSQAPVPYMGHPY